jgi:hypothetical protein
MTNTIKYCHYWTGLPFRGNSSFGRGLVDLSWYDVGCANWDTLYKLHRFPLEPSHSFWRLLFPRPQWAGNVEGIDSAVVLFFGIAHILFYFFSETLQPSLVYSLSQWNLNDMLFRTNLLPLLVMLLLDLSQWRWIKLKSFVRRSDIFNTSN